jgi:hypothetical protein
MTTPGRGQTLCDGAIATLAVRMREMVHRLSEDWETRSEHATEQLEAHSS